MTETDSSITERTLHQQTVEVPQEHNFLLTSLREHSWVSISFGDQEIASNHTASRYFSLMVSPGHYKVVSDGVIESTVSQFMQTPAFAFARLQQRPPAQLRLTSDAPDQHVVDGIGEVPANGTSSCMITVEAVAPNDAPLSEEAQQSEVFLRTTGGVLMDAAGGHRLRAVTLKSGLARFRLVSEASRKVVTVSAFGQSHVLLKGEIQIEFV